MNHALLAPSSASRWINCTPSAVLESYEPNISSKFALEGTDAHTLAELKLRIRFDPINKRKYETERELFIANSEFYDQDMEEFTDAYIQEIVNIVELDYRDCQVKIYFEERLDLSHIIPNGSGTSDVVIVGPDFIHIIDLKYGRGVEVSAVNNAQCRLYAAGAVKGHLLDCACRTVRMTIIQPRLYTCSTDEMSIIDLNTWLSEVVRPKALLAAEGKGQRCAGDHCKFCKVKSKCDILSNQMLEAAKAEFEDIVVTNQFLQPSELTPEMYKRILQIGPKFSAYFSEIIDYCTQQAINGNLVIPGYKVVEGRSKRILTMHDEVTAILESKGYDSSSYQTEPKLLGITALEKNIGAKNFNKLCGHCIIKPPGKPTLVPNTDNRPVFNSEQYRLTGSEFND